MPNNATMLQVQRYSRLRLFFDFTFCTPHMSCTGFSN